MRRTCRISTGSSSWPSTRAKSTLSGFARWADVVLIDSRTGVTEMGGVCTRQMADAVISFCAPNWQNLDGVARIVSSLGTAAANQARFNRDLQVLVIPTRIDDSESFLAGEFAEEFDRKLEIQNLPSGLVSN